MVVLLAAVFKFVTAGASVSCNSRSRSITHLMLSGIDWSTINLHEDTHKRSSAALHSHRRGAIPNTPKLSPSVQVCIRARALRAWERGVQMAGPGSGGDVVCLEDSEVLIHDQIGLDCKLRNILVLLVAEVTLERGRSGPTKPITSRQAAPRIACEPTANRRSKWPTNAHGNAEGRSFRAGRCPPQPTAL